MLFYSPMAWILLLCFIVQSGIYFCGKYDYFLMNMQRYGGVVNASSWVFVSQASIGSAGRGLWLQMSDMLNLYIPLLTMGIVGREFTSGSIKLLYSSPVKNSQIILGKFAALVVFALVLTGTLLIYVIYAWVTIDHFELGWILTAWLGMFLLACAYMAVGLFISSLTSYQLMAAIGTFIVLAGLDVIGGVGQHYAWVRDVTSWLSIRSRTAGFMGGLICSEDLIYFVVICAMFVAFAIIRLNAVRRRQRFVVTAGKNVVVVAIVCGLALITSQPMFKKYHDATSMERNTLHPKSQEVVAQLDGALSMTCYVNVVDPYYISDFTYPGFVLKQRGLFEKYTRFKPETKLEVVYYYAEIAREKALGNYKEKSAEERAREACKKCGLDFSKLKTKEEIDRQVDLSEEDYYTIWQIERGNGQKGWLRSYLTGVSRFPKEAEITVALKRLVEPMEVMAFATGHGERSIMDNGPQGYGQIGNNKKAQTSLWNHGFDVMEVSLGQPVPEEVSVLTIADPRRVFTEEEKENLNHYLARGGNLLFLAEPAFRGVVNPWLTEVLGVEITPLLVGNRRVNPQLLDCRPTPTAVDSMYRISRVCMPECGGVEFVAERGFRSFPIVTCDTTLEAWTELETTDFVDDTVRFNPAVGEVKKHFATMVGLERQVGAKRQRIIVAGDADCLSNNVYSVNRRNGTVIHSLANWLTDGTVPLDLDKGMGPDRKVDVTRASYRTLRWLFMFIVPMGVLGCALFIWFRRRSR